MGRPMLSDRPSGFRYSFSRLSLPFLKMNRRARALYVILLSEEMVPTLTFSPNCVNHRNAGAAVPDPHSDDIHSVRVLGEDDDEMQQRRQRHVSKTSRRQRAPRVVGGGYRTPRRLRPLPPSLPSICFEPKANCRRQRQSSSKREATFNLSSSLFHHSGFLMTGGKDAS